jgi:hypothetical protein
MNAKVQNTYSDCPRARWTNPGAADGGPALISLNAEEQVRTDTLIVLTCTKAG